MRSHSAIPDARLLVFEEMGHDLPRPLWDPMLDAIASHILGVSEAEADGRSNRQV